MKYQIDTVPVWDAYKENGECPFCAIRRRVEEKEIGYFLGESVMEPAQRMEVNQKYFCPSHLSMLHAEGNHLGLALMTHTYLKNLLPGMAKNGEELVKSSKKDAIKPFNLRKNARRKIAAIRELTGSCVLCERLQANMDRYAYTALHLFKTDPEFREAFSASKGLCLEHYACLMEMAVNCLSGKDYTEFMQSVTKLENDNLHRMEEEIHWFTLKFDYRNADKPWGNSEDSVKRCANKLRHEIIED